MVVTNTIDGMDFYSLKRQRHSGTIEYEVHRDRRIYGVAFLDEDNVVATNEGSFVFAKFGHEAAEIRSVLEHPDQEVLQLVVSRLSSDLDRVLNASQSTGFIEDKQYIVATHNLLSREPRGERFVMVAHQVTREEVRSNHCVSIVFTD